MAAAQVEWLAPNVPFGWLIGVVVGSLIGGLVGAFQGYWVAYQGVPSFIVTLAGLLIWRGGAWLVTQGRTVAPLDASFQTLGRRLDRRHLELGRRGRGDSGPFNRYTAGPREAATARVPRQTALG